MKNNIYVGGFAVVLLLLLSSCGERTARIDKPESYNSGGLQFEYPGNWKVTDDTDQDEIRQITVESPGDAIVIIQLFPALGEVGIQDYAQIFSSAARENTPIGIISPSEFSNVEGADGYEILKEKFSISVLGQSTPFTRTFRRKVIDDTVCFIVANVSDEDQSKVVRGFEQICETLSYRAR